MKIIHFCDTISIGGGIASFVNDLAVEQSKTDNVSLGVLSSLPNVNRMEFPEDIRIVDFKKFRPGFSLIYPLKIFFHLLRSNYDVVHIHSSFLYYFLSVLLLHKKFKFIYTVHSDAVKENSSSWDKRFWKIKRWCFKNNWILPVTISPNSKLVFDDLYGLHSALVNNGIRRNPISCGTNELGRYRLTTKTRLFLHVGRITEAKNQVTLCKAFSQLITEGYDVSLVIVGVNQDQRIFDEIRSLLCDRIIYIGERTDIRELFSEADAMCLSSVWEGMPITLLEALSVGCIPVCTPVGGIVNVINDGYNGFLSDSTDVQSYKSALIRFLGMSEDEISEMKTHVLESFQLYDISHVAQNYLNVYTSK